MHTTHVFPAILAGLLLGGSVAAQTIERISVNASGDQANDWCFLTENGSTAVTPDVGLVTFRSNATNLDPVDLDFLGEQFVRDTIGASTMTEQPDGPSMAPCLSQSGGYVTLSSSATNLVVEDRDNFSDILVHDLTTGR